jgi:hypothetical protein
MQDAKVGANSSMKPDGTIGGVMAPKVQFFIILILNSVYIKL